MEEHKLDQEEGRIDLYRLLPELGRALRRLFWVPLLLALLALAIGLGSGRLLELSLIGVGGGL